MTPTFPPRRPPCCPGGHVFRGELGGLGFPRAFPGWRVTPHVSLHDVSGFLVRPHLNFAGPRGGQGRSFLAPEGTDVVSLARQRGALHSARLPERGPGM